MHILTYIDVRKISHVIRKESETRKPLPHTHTHSKHECTSARRLKEGVLMWQQSAKIMCALDWSEIYVLAISGNISCYYLLIISGCSLFVPKVYVFEGGRQHVSYVFLHIFMQRGSFKEQLFVRSCLEDDTSLFFLVVWVFFHRLKERNGFDWIL